MGYSQSWVAVKGKSSQNIYDQLGLRPTGEKEELPEAPFTSTNLPNGWLLVVADRNERLADDFILSPLSGGCELVACFVEEHVMFSTSVSWKNGNKIWSVTHDAQKSIEHLDTVGALPSEFVSIRDEKTSAQLADGGKDAGVDHIFDIPVNLAALITGFRYDQDLSGEDKTPFAVLAGQLPKPEKKSWLKRLLG